MKQKQYILSTVAIFVCILAITISSCNKPSLTTDPNDSVVFSTDTLLFDTVFTTVGSVTKSFRIINQNNQDIELSAIQLSGGSNSPYRINIDGEPAIEANNVVIGAEDSLWIFVEVTVDPTEENLPFIVQDSVMIEVNGNLEKVDLLAFGQNAHFYNRDTLSTATWIDDKPHVIYGWIVVDSLQTLTIEQGVNVHLHNGASIVSIGNLIVNGQADSLVTFSGTRLESSFDKVPGQWGAIFLHRNTVNSFQYADVANGVFGIAAGQDLTVDICAYGSAGNTVCTIKNCILRHNFASNLRTLLADVTVENSLFYNSLRNVEVLLGGNVEFNHSTLAAVYFDRISHDQPTLLLNTIAGTETCIATADVESAIFNNSIIYGNLLEELEINAFADDSLMIETNINFQFNNCLVKTEADSIGIPPQFTNVVFNTNPNFFDPSETEDYNLTENSAAIGTASTNNSLPTDLLNRMRDANPDIGCLEFFP